MEPDEHTRALMDERLRWLMMWLEERDRRYTEVDVEKEKALKIKETADLAALSLAREIQTYKDEKANELREQINNERGLYATKEDLHNAIREVTASLKPLNEYVSAQAGRSSGMGSLYGWLLGIAGLIVSVIVMVNVMTSR